MRRKYIQSPPPRWQGLLLSPPILDRTTPTWKHPRIGPNGNSPNHSPQFLLLRLLLLLLLLFLLSDSLIDAQHVLPICHIHQCLHHNRTHGRMRRQQLGQPLQKLLRPFLGIQPRCCHHRRMQPDIFAEAGEADSGSVDGFVIAHEDLSIGIDSSSEFFCGTGACDELTGGVNFEGSGSGWGHDVGGFSAETTILAFGHVGLSG
mmetsp:Transcript_12354/g.26065  ORF Transcript_12354/g.26065 Transcript_12354/m.26065 type:complete len:204 (-) Transcript_12354:771-1382(-)